MPDLWEIVEGDRGIYDPEPSRAADLSLTAPRTEAVFGFRPATAGKVMSTLTSDDRSLPPWKAGLGLLFCGLIAWFAYVHQLYWQACVMSLLSGMFLQDWVYRFRDKHDPDRNVGRSGHR